MNGFCQHMKLKAHFKDNTEIKEQNRRLLKTNHRKWTPNKIHQTIKRFIEATKNGVKDELKTMCTGRHTNLSKKRTNNIRRTKTQKILS